MNFRGSFKVDKHHPLILIIPEYISRNRVVIPNPQSSNIILELFNLELRISHPLHLVGSHSLLAFG